MSLHLQKIELPKRKTWDKEKFAKIAKEKKDRETQEILNLDLDELKNQPSHTEKRHKGTIIKRDFLRPHRHDINLNEKIGKRQLITDTTADHEKSAWYCFDCKCQLKDSHTYLDHINGKKHQRVLGMSMKTPTSTLSQVKNRLDYHTKKRNRNEFEDSMDVAERIELRKAKHKRQKELKKQSKKRRKLAKKQAEMDNEYGSLHNNDNNGHKYKNNKVKKDEIEYVKEGIDPEMAAMGFTFSFGGSKKT